MSVMVSMIIMSVMMVMSTSSVGGYGVGVVERGRSTYTWHQSRREAFWIQLTCCSGRKARVRVLDSLLALGFESCVVNLLLVGSGAFCSYEVASERDKALGETSLPSLSLLFCILAYLACLKMMVRRKL